MSGLTKLDNKMLKEPVAQSVLKLQRKLSNGIVEKYDLLNSAPFNIGEGGTTVYDGKDLIYTFRGDNSSTFLYYSISGDKWGALNITPGLINAGASLVYTGENYI